MPPDIAARLRDLYADDVRRLESLVGRDLGAWVTGSERPSEGGGG
jgi:hypothetical protein